MKLKYHGDDVRIYPSLNLVVSPGDVVELGAAPDARFSPVKDAKPSDPASKEK